MAKKAKSSSKRSTTKKPLAKTKKKTSASTRATKKSAKSSSTKRPASPPVGGSAIPPRKPLPFNGGLPRAADVDVQGVTLSKGKSTTLNRIKRNLSKFQDLLEKRRERLLADVQRRVRQSSDRTADLVGDEADRAVDAASADLDLRLTEKESQELALIQEALSKIAEGTYGICEGTGEPIEFDRLLAIPHARYSLQWQRMQEVQSGRTLEELEMSGAEDEGWEDEESRD